MMRVSRRVGDASNVPNDLPGHHGDEAPRRKLSLGGFCARVSSALRVSPSRLAIVRQTQVVKMKDKRNTNKKIQKNT